MNPPTDTRPPSEPFETCPACGSARVKVFMNAPDFDTGKTTYTLLECQDCEMVWTTPPLTDAQLGAFYSQEYYGTAEQKFVSFLEQWTRWDAQRRAKHLLAQLASPTSQQPMTIVDIGCGRGTLLRALAACGCRAIGIERSEFPEHETLPANATVYRVALDAVPLAQHSVDAVILWHVLEHLSAPFAVLEQANRWLRPGGLLLIAVPNLHSWQAWWAGRHWFHLDLPRHRYHWSADRLAQAGVVQGFRLQRIAYWHGDQQLYGALQSLLNRLIFFRPPNRLYALLRCQSRQRPWWEWVAWLTLSGCVLPLVMLDGLIGWVTRRPAVVALTMRKVASCNHNQEIEKTTRPIEKNRHASQ